MNLGEQNFGYEGERSIRSQLFNGLWLILVVFTIALWSYSLVTFPDSIAASVLYIMLGLISLILFLADKQFAITKHIFGDIPVDMICFENFKFKHVLYGVLLALVFVGMSFLKSGPIHSVFGIPEGNILFTGVPSAAVSTFSSLTPVWKALYIGSVALPENQAIAIWIAATLTAFSMVALGKPSTTKYLFLSFIFSIVAAIIACFYHGVIYQNQLSTLVGVGIFFGVNTFLTMYWRDASGFFACHLVYNFALIFFSLVGTAAIGI